MKMSSDIGPQILPASFGPQPSVKLLPDVGPQINPGIGGGKSSDFTGPQINPGVGPDPFTKLGYHGPQINPGMYGQPTRVVEQSFRSRFFPSATGLPGDPSLYHLESYQGGNPGAISRFGVRRGWTFDF